MDARQWQEIEGIFHAALERPPGERAAFLDAACGGKLDQRREVEQLLAQDEKPTVPFDTPAAERATFLHAGLPPGTQLGPYRIIDSLGSGGMGTVHRAQDTRLGRTVAIKMLHAGATLSSAMRQRFEREARAIAALNHPHICAIYDVGSHDGDSYLVMEHVEGETLAARLKKSSLDLRSALTMASQVAAALAAAHAKGIIHRDLKPENVMLTAAGAKVLDFGLATTSAVAVAAASGTAPCSLTADGMIVGTVAYMSPEQACGKEVDTRTDIWSFGCLLYESLAAARPFKAPTVTELLAAVIEREPDWSALPAGLPLQLVSLLKRCLRKDLHHRLRDIGDAQIELEDLLAAPASDTPTQGGRPLSVRWAALCAAAGAAVTVALLLGVRVLNPTPPAATSQTVKFTIAPKDLARGSGADIDTEVSISRDGRRIAFVEAADGQFWLRDIDHDQPRPVPGAKGVYQVFWSPDNQTIGYDDRGTLFKIPVEGGTPVPICKVTGQFRRANWSSDGETIVFADDTGLNTVPTRGGTPARMMSYSHIEHPSFIDLPGHRRAVLYQAGPGGPTEKPLDPGPGHGVYVQVVGENQPRLLFRSSSINPYPTYSPRGYIIYVDGQLDSVAIWAVPFSLTTLQITGKPFPIAQHASSPQLSLTDTLVYSDAPSSRQQIAWFDRSGKVLSTVGEPLRQDNPRLSPDGRQLAVQVTEGDPDIFIYDLARGIKTRFTFEGKPAVPSAWTPSGSEITYLSMKNGNPDIFSKPSSGAGEAHLLSGTPDPELSPDWSRDQRFLIYQVNSKDTKGDIFYRERHPDGTLGDPVTFLATPFNETSPAFSPDGRFVAYSSNESGGNEIYIREFPSGANKTQVSSHGGRSPRWRKDGKELFYLTGRGMMSAAITTRPALSPGVPTLLFGSRSLQFGYDVSPDGQRFLVMEQAANPQPLTIHVVQNWFEEYRGRPTQDTPR